MSIRATAVLVLFSAIAAPSAFAYDDDSKKRWRRGDWQSNWRDDRWARPCEVKQESKRGEFKREVKCKDGVGATWQGEWKDEFQDGPCKVKLEASREVFKEEVKCKER
ncbi:putative membrane protein [Variovorax paradoxus B4]|uniref:Putative membrane protein n=1 Tax=Variovorax paradoxus B4 TaxID=1246301 RepID=T1XNN8_VARPD|nr:hypothetical protein [Variovorax paradoxus]AGU53735.1 putative membrane protein [Variovorax paradoxus B4]